MFVFSRHRSIREKLIVSCIIITIIPMIILEIVFGVQTKNAEYKRRIEDADILADNLIRNFTFEIEKAELMANNLAEFTPLDTYLNTQFSDHHEQFNYYFHVIHPMIAGYNNSKGNTRIRVYHNKKIQNYSLELTNTLDEFTKENFREDPFVKGSSFWIHLDCYPFHPVLSYFRTVQDQVTNYNTSYVTAVHLRERAFSGYIGVEPENTLIILTDQNGNILTSNNRDYSRQSIRELDCSADSMDELLHMHEVSISGDKYYVIGRKTDLLSLAVLVSDKNLKREFFASVAYFIVIGCILFVIAAVLISYSTGKITKGIGKLMNKMHDVSRSRIHLMANDPTAEGSRDEIDQLDSAFTKMMQQIDELVEKVKSEESKLKDEIISRQQAELSFLQQQINPHYLFNTLEAIRMNLYLKNDRETASMIKIFAESFRRYIGIRDSITTLFEEVAFIEKFIAIQNYRLGNKIRFRLNAKEHDLSTNILKLLIQPVVENSVIHGLEEKQEGGTIELNVKKTSGFLTIVVSDDGVGLSGEELARIRENLHGDQQMHSVALRNVYRRMKLYYGEEADLTIESKLGEGSTVTLIIPMAKEGGNV